MCHVTKLKSSQTGSWDNEVTVFKMIPQSPDLYSIEHLMDVVEWKIYVLDVQLRKLQQLCDGVMSIKARIVEGPRMLYLEHSSCNKLKIMSLLSIAIYSLPFTFRLLLGYEIMLSN